MSDILSENQNIRQEIPLPLLICFSFYTTWQMGMIYFSGTAASINGRMGLPMEIGNIAPIVAAGYLLSILFITLFPQKIVLAARVTVLISLISITALFFHLPETILTWCYFGHCLSCVFMVGFEMSIITTLFTKKSLIRHCYIAYAVACGLIAVLQNDIHPVSFAHFRCFTLIMLLLLLAFFFHLPAHSWARYIPQREHPIYPKKLFTGLYLLSGLGAVMTLFGSAVAEHAANGVMLYYISAAILGLVVFLLWKWCGISPVRTSSVLAGVSAVGFVLGMVALFCSIEPLLLLASVFLGSGLVVCNISFFCCYVILEKYPVRWVVPTMIGISFGAMILHMVLLETFRQNWWLLYTIYFIIAVLLVLVYHMLEPYLLYLFYKKPETNITDASISAVPHERNKREALLTLYAFDKLSGQELRLAELILQGYTNGEMAKTLNITENTVKGYRKNLYSKLQIHSKRELFELADGRNTSK